MFITVRHFTVSLIFSCKVWSLPVLITLTLMRYKKLLPFWQRKIRLLAKKPASNSTKLSLLVIIKASNYKDRAYGHAWQPCLARPRLARPRLSKPSRWLARSRLTRPRLARLRLTRPSRWLAWPRLARPRLAGPRLTRPSRWQAMQRLARQRPGLDKPQLARQVMVLTSV